MHVFKPTAALMFGLLCVSCTEAGDPLAAPTRVPMVTAASEGSLVIPIAEDGVFCFDGEWSPPLGTHDPMTWPAGWGNVAILLPESGVTPPPDLLRLKGDPSQTQVHYGSSGTIALRYEGEAYEGYGHSQFTWFYNASRGGVRVVAAIEGKVQDAWGAWYSLTCKGINDDMANEEYVVTWMNLTRAR